MRYLISCSYNATAEVEEETYLRLLDTYRSHITGLLALQVNTINIINIKKISAKRLVFYPNSSATQKSMKL
jgi:hypothetical protein